MGQPMSCVLGYVWSRSQLFSWVQDGHGDLLGMFPSIDIALANRCKDGTLLAVAVQTERSVQSLYEELVRHRLTYCGEPFMSDFVTRDPARVDPSWVFRGYFVTDYWFMAPQYPQADLSPAARNSLLDTPKHASEYHQFLDEAYSEFNPHYTFEIWEVVQQVTIQGRSSCDGEDDVHL